MKCGKATCACHADPDARHGPYLGISRVVEGRTQARYVTPEQSALVREQLAAGHAFRARLEEFWRDCETWADTELEVASGEAPTVDAKKGGSRRTLRRTSRKESKR